MSYSTAPEDAASAGGSPDPPPAAARALQTRSAPIAPSTPPELPESIQFWWSLRERATRGGHRRDTWQSEVSTAPPLCGQGRNPTSGSGLDEGFPAAGPRRSAAPPKAQSAPPPEHCVVH